MKKWLGVSTLFGFLVVGMLMVLPIGQAADMTKDLATKYILATAKAARTVYVKDIIRKAKEGGVKPNEGWADSADHAIMLPAQFVKAVGAKISDFELTLVGTAPLYPSNAPKTDKEKAILDQLAKGGEKVLTFQDGDQFKGMSADFAIVQGCADCHNKHPKPPKKIGKRVILWVLLLSG